MMTSKLSLTSLRRQSKHIARSTNSSIFKLSNCDCKSSYGKLRSMHTGPVVPEVGPQTFDIEKLAQMKPTPVTLKEIIEFGNEPNEDTLLRSAQFLQHELPIRFAHQYKRLQNAPGGLNETPSIGRITRLYALSLTKLTSVPTVRTSEDEKQFTEAVATVYENHKDVLPILATSINELKSSKEYNEEVDVEVHSFMNKFIMARIGIRMLMGQHIGLRSSEEGYVGMVMPNCSPADVVNHAFQQARDLCLLTHGVAPSMELNGNLECTFPYVPSHLFLMVFELLKNSLHATIEFYTEKAAKVGKDKEDIEFPPIRVTIYEDKEDVSIKISDRGGGIPRSGLAKIHKYLYSTARTRPRSYESDDPYRSDQVIVSGFGYGIPIVKQYAQYFGGDLVIVSFGGGTDAFLYLSKLAQVEEALPEKHKRIVKVPTLDL